MKELCKKIGLETQSDLLRFKNEQQIEGETLLEALTRYSNELGENFKIMEGLER